MTTIIPPTTSTLLYAEGHQERSLINMTYLKGVKENLKAGKQEDLLFLVKKMTIDIAKGAGKNCYKFVSLLSLLLDKPETNQKTRDLAEGICKMFYQMELFKQEPLSVSSKAAFKENLRVQGSNGSVYFNRFLLEIFCPTLWEKLKSSYEISTFSEIGKPSSKSYSERGSAHCSEFDKTTLTDFRNYLFDPNFKMPVDLVGILNLFDLAVHVKDKVLGEKCTEALVQFETADEQAIENFNTRINTCESLNESFKNELIIEKVVSYLSKSGQRVYWSNSDMGLFLDQSSYYLYENAQRALGIVGRWIDKNTVGVIVNPKDSNELNEILLHKVKNKLTKLKINLMDHIDLASISNLLISLPKDQLGELKSIEFNIYDKIGIELNADILKFFESNCPNMRFLLSTPTDGVIVMNDVLQKKLSDRRVQLEGMVNIKDYMGEVKIHIEGHRII